MTNPIKHFSCPTIEFRCSGCRKLYHILVSRCALDIEESDGEESTASLITLSYVCDDPGCEEITILLESVA